MAKRDDPRDRLLDWLVLEFERQWYGQYVPIPADKTLGEERMEILWRILDQSLSLDNPGEPQQGVNECLLLVWPKEGGRAFGDAATAKYFLSKRNGDLHGLLNVEEVRDPWNVVREWLCTDSDYGKSTILPNATSRYRLLAGYFSFRVDGHNAEQLGRADDLVERPIYRRNHETSDLERRSAANGWFPTADTDIYRDKPVTDGAHYYQRIAIGFGCGDARTAECIAAFASRIVGVLVASWSYELEEERGGISHLQAWAHETGTCQRILSYAAEKLDSLGISSPNRMVDTPDVTTIAQIVRDCADWILLYSATGKRDTDLGSYKCEGATWDAVRENLLTWAAKVAHFRRFQLRPDVLGRASQELPRLVLDVGFLAEHASTAQLHFINTQLETAFVQSLVAAVTNAFNHISLGDDGGRTSSDDGPRVLLAYDNQSEPRSFGVVNRLSQDHQNTICSGKRMTLPDISSGTQLAIRVACEAMGFWGGKGGVFFDGVPTDRLHNIVSFASDVQRLWPSEKAVWLTRFPVPANCFQSNGGDLS